MGFDVVSYWAWTWRRPTTAKWATWASSLTRPAVALLFAPFTVLPWPAFLTCGTRSWSRQSLPGRRSSLCAAGFPSRRDRSLSRQHPSAHRGGPRAWLPIPAGVGVRASVQGHAGDRSAVVRGPSRVASLGIALGATGVIVVVTALLLPNQWLSWVQMLVSSAGTPPPWPALPIPIWIRLTARCGAHRVGRATRCTLDGAVAVAISVPALWPGAFAILAAVWPLRRRQAQHSAAAAATAEDIDRGYHAANAGQRGRARHPPRPSVTLVLPAYNESARIGSALDELFGYLHRTGPLREGGRSATDMGAVEVIVVDDGSEDDTAAIVAARPEAQSSERPTLRVLREPHTGKGGAVRAGMLVAEFRLHPFRRRRPGDPARPAAAADRRSRHKRSGTRVSRVHPDGSDRAPDAAPSRRALGKVFHAIGRVVGDGPRA